MYAVNDGIRQATAVIMAVKNVSDFTPQLGGNEACHSGGH